MRNVKSATDFRLHVHLLLSSGPDPRISMKCFFVKRWLFDSNLGYRPGIRVGLYGSFFMHRNRRDRKSIIPRNT